MSKIPHNLHDKVFKALMSDADFSIRFFQAYLPEALVGKVVWDSLKLYELKTSRQQRTVKKDRVADLVYLADLMLDATEKQKEKLMIFWHAEHQSTPDRLMPIRDLNYKTNILLNYADNNRIEKLPMVVSIIYYQGVKPYPYSMAIEDCFVSPELARTLGLKPTLVNLAALSDEALKQHEGIYAAELMLKHIRRDKFDQYLEEIFVELQHYGDGVRQTMLEYVITLANTDKSTLFQKALQYLPQEEETIMRVGEQIRQEGIAKGLADGITEGIERGIKQGIRQGIKQGIEQGLQQGIEQGVEQGLQQGIEQGVEQGLQQGIEQGVEQGIEQGMEKGLVQGIELRNYEIARTLLQKQLLNDDEILEATGLPPTVFIELKKGILGHKS